MNDEDKADEMAYKFSVAMFMWLTNKDDPASPKEARQIIHMNVDRMIDRHLETNKQKTKCEKCGK